MSLPDDAFLRLKELLVEERMRRKAAERTVEHIEQELIIARARHAHDINRTIEKAREERKRKEHRHA